MKKYIYSTLLAFTLLTGFSSASAATVYVDLNATGTADGSTQANAFTTIQAAISSASTTNGDIISIADGTYVVTSTIDVSKELTIQGTTQAGTIIDASSISGNYGISSSKSNLIFSNFTLMGPSVNISGNFGIKISGTTSNTPSAAPYAQDGVRSTNINITNVTVKDSGRTGIDINGVNNVTLNNVTVRDSKSGNGVSFTDSSNITLSNVTTSLNTWGGIALYTQGRFYPGGINNVTVNNLTASEANPLYSQLSNPLAGVVYPITGVTAAQFPFTGVNSIAPASTYVLYRNDPFVAAANAQSLNVSGTTTIRNLGSIVNVGSQSIQAQIDAATAGDTIDISGTYYINTQINVNKSVTLRGLGANKTINVSGTSYLFLITAPNVTIQDLAINKTDIGVDKNIIGIQAASTTIKNNTFTGQYTSNNEISRAVEVGAVGNNFLITGNSVTNLRQPAYINAATGTVSNNYVTGTRGWVIVSDSNVTLTGNTWGTNTPLDIAIIPANTNNYSTTTMDAIKLANNNANITNQFSNYTPAPIVIVPPVVVSGGGSTGGSIPLSFLINNGSIVSVNLPTVNTPVTNPTTNNLQVLGASTFKFNNNLRSGMRTNDVTELHKVLIAQGYLKITSPTGYFGPLTKNAVKEWQAKNIKLSTGFFGPISRAFINK